MSKYIDIGSAVLISTSYKKAEKRAKNEHARVVIHLQAL
jgi:hypothetical protein